MPQDFGLTTFLALRTVFLSFSSMLGTFAFGTLIFAQEIFSSTTSIVVGLGMVSILNGSVFYFRFKFSFWHSLEIVNGAALFVLAPFASQQQLMLIMFALGGLGMFRPLSAGPEPGGWWPILQAEREAQQERLKGRDEK
jgi:hypothetical protein